jgi:hypothetical protein
MFEVVFRADSAKGELPEVQGCPIQLSAVQISRDDEAAEAFLQVKVKNVSESNVGSIVISADLCSSGGATEQVLFEYRDLALSIGAEEALAPKKLSRPDFVSCSLKVAGVEKQSASGNTAVAPESPVPKEKEEAPAKKSASSSQKAAGIVAIVSAALLCISGFLPYTDATGVLGSSLFSWASIFFASYLDQGGSVVVPLLIWMTGIFALLALLFAVLKKATPIAVFALLSLAMLAMLSGMFEGELVATGYCTWGFGHLLGFIASFASIASAVWLFVVKHNAKKAL